MLIFENIKLALNGLLSNKLRSLLTMLGIIIGTYSTLFVATPIAYELQKKKINKKAAAEKAGK